MQKGQLRTIISRQKLEKENLQSIPYIDRDKLTQGKRWMSSELIKVILGPRRSGKSVFSLMLLKNYDFAYFNFDDPAIVNKDLNLYELIDEIKSIYGKTKYILFDEIQNLPSWELFANRLHRQGYNIVLTGSNANLLSMELATHLTGRHLPIEILPLNFAEILRANKNKNQNELLEKYLINGGFPEVVLKNQQPLGYLDILFDSVLFKDVVKRHNVRFSEQASQLGSYLINNTSSQYSSRRLTNILNFKSDVTLEKYLGYLTEAYIIFPLSRYSAKAGIRIKSPKKIYVIDNGFITAKAVQHSLDQGKLMENLVFTELMKRGFKPNHDLFYYKTRNDREVDFIIKKEHKVIELIQVCYNISDFDVKQREMKSLLEAKEELNVEKLTILTWDDEKTEELIHFKPLLKWLTEKL
ncbi:MAG: ATP-binding protein [Candidatus Pacebacteria bacterium]|nr:ATP-binding protein [Candidatus Paceibacterota bacterium]